MNTLSLINAFLKIFDLIVRVKNIFMYYVWDKLYHGCICKRDFYFKKYKKHLTIYQNGNGILINSCVIRVLNEENFKKIEREVNIEDAKIGTYFPSLNKMLMTDICSRFNEFGFWYSCDSDSSDKLVDQITEIESDNHKTLQWDFHIKKSVLKSKRKKIFNLTYALCIPNMFPIENGHLDLENQPYEDYKFSSSLEVKHKINNLEYIVSFEKGIEINDIDCYSNYNSKSNNSSTNREIHCKLKYESDLFYDKYIILNNNPKISSKISFVWDIK